MRKDKWSRLHKWLDDFNGAEIPVIKLSNDCKLNERSVRRMLTMLDGERIIREGSSPNIRWFKRH